MPVLDLPSLGIDDEGLLTLPSVVGAQLYGETDDEKLSEIANNDLAERDFLYTLAIMCSPDDDSKKAHRLSEALLHEELYYAARGMQELGLEANMSGSMALGIADRENPLKLIGQLIHKDNLAHIACGYILRRVVSMHESPDTRSNASLNEAARTVEEWCSNHRVIGGGQRNLTRNLWQKYKSVSHLWAAFYLMQEAGAWQKRTAPERMTLFFGTAQWLLDQGVTIRPKGSRPSDRLISVEDMWTIPPSFVPRLDDGTIRYRVWNSDPAAHDLRGKGGVPRPR